MINPFIKISKKIFFATIATVVIFGFSAETAFANPHTPPTLAKQIATDLGVPTNILSAVREIDNFLYTNTYVGTPPKAKYPLDYPISSSQINTIIGNIENDGSVVSSLKAYNTAYSTWQQADIDCKNYAFGIGCEKAAAANEAGAIQLLSALNEAAYNLEAAGQKLGDAVVAARESQQSLINSYKATNDKNQLFLDKANSMTGSETAALSDIAQLEGLDASLASPYSDTNPAAMPSAEEIAAKQAEHENFLNQLNSNPLAVQMQEACSLGILPGTTMNLTACIANLTYNIVYKPTMYLLIGSGYIFDKMLDLSIDTSFVNQPFVSTSWAVIRDFANMLFIFILLYTGIMTIFGATDWRRVVLQVIFIALVINFSLFFTKVIIDAGNIIAVGIRSAIASGQSVSEGLAAGFQPQKFVNVATQGDTSGGDAIVVFIISAIVTGFAAYIFFKGAILFIRRIVVFWALMILSPFAFISTALPGKANRFSEWLNELINQTFVVPIFLFFIYVIMTAISADGGILNSSHFTQSGDGWFSSLIAPAIIAMLIIKALQETLKFAEGMAGSTGETVSGLVSGAMGLATGGTATLAGMAGRKAIGGGAAMLLKSGTLEAGSASEKAAQWATRASFDVRNAPLPGVASKGLKSLGIDIGKGGGVGGVEKIEKDRVDAALKAAGAAKANVFQEQGVYSRVQKGTGPEFEKYQAKVATAKATAETASSLTTRLKAQAEAEKKTNEELTAAITTAKTNYEAAVKEGNQELINEAKNALEKAEVSHATSGSSATLQSTLAKLEEAKKAEKEALDALDKVAKMDVADIAKEAITEANKVRTETYANVVESGGVFIGGQYTNKANALAAAKIRKGEKAGPKTPVEELKAAIEKVTAAETKPATAAPTNTPTH